MIPGLLAMLAAPGCRSAAPAPGPDAADFPLAWHEMVPTGADPPFEPYCGEYAMRFDLVGGTPATWKTSEFSLQFPRVEAVTVNGNSGWYLYAESGERAASFAWESPPSIGRWAFAGTHAGVQYFGVVSANGDVGGVPGCGH